MPQDLATFDVSANGADVVVSIAGEIDVVSAADFERVLVEHVDSPMRLTLDMSETTFMDSSGLKVVAATALARSSAGRLQVRGAPPQVRRLFDLTGVDRLVELVPTIDTPIPLDA